MAMAIGGEDRLDHINRHAWERFAQEVRLDPSWVEAEFVDMASRLLDALADTRATLALPEASAVGSLLQDRLSEWIGDADW